MLSNHMYLNKLWASGVTLVTSFLTILCFHLFQHIYLCIFRTRRKPKRLAIARVAVNPTLFGQGTVTREGAYISMYLTLS